LVLDVDTDKQSRVSLSDLAAEVVPSSIRMLKWLSVLSFLASTCVASREAGE